MFYPDVKQLLIDAQNNRNNQMKKEETAGEYDRRQANPIGEILKDHLYKILMSDDFTYQQKKAASMMAKCQTEELGGYVEYCENCGKAVDFHYCSCNNRNCPNCQYPMQQKWIEMRKNEIIPGIPYYHIILTCPHTLNPLFQANQSLLLGLLMRASSRAVIKMCENPDVLGAKPAILSVLHTWSSDLKLHYHVHMLVSGGGLNSDGNFVRLTDLRDEQKKAREAAKCLKEGIQFDPNKVSNDNDSGNDYFINLPALTVLYRGIFMSELRELYQKHKLTLPDNLDYLNDPNDWSRFCHKHEVTDWVGDIEKTSSGGINVVEYFARYSYRTAISNSRITKYDGKFVHFIVKVKDKDDPKKRNNKEISLDVYTFIRRFLSHILPKNFSRVRTFGILSNAQKSKNLKNIHDQTDGIPYTPSPFKGLKGLDLIKKLMPDKDFGVCPFCKGTVTSIPFGAALDILKLAEKRQRKRGA